ncbi:hypothetical protein BLNAU_3935 [Blattamonas nauphoetae]|uniref:Uncharacterized protein n=1 Tax=Blattamonas nauphoetae TaxID=2049346 RepID=A0ABQ9YBM3_9EUKA|nr:hypothetical protein BLNAU_3935 [Blattamonas nauphoetae]
MPLLSGTLFNALNPIVISIPDEPNRLTSVAISDESNETVAVLTLSGPTGIISSTSLHSLTLQTVVIEQDLTSQPNFDVSEENKVEALCHWTGGVIELTESTCTVEGSRKCEHQRSKWRGQKAGPAFAVNGLVELHADEADDEVDAGWNTADAV